MLNDEQKMQVYRVVYQVADHYSITFEEVVALLVEVSDDDHIADAILAKGKKSRRAPKSRIVFDAGKNVWRLSTPLDDLDKPAEI